VQKRTFGRWRGALSALLVSATLSAAACGGGASGGDYGQTADDAYAAAQRLETQGDLERATSAYRAALQQNPRLFPARLSLAYLLQRRQQWAASLEQAQEAARLDPRSVAARLLVAQNSLELGDAARALEVSQEAQALDQGNPEALELEGRALWALERRRDALEVYQQLVEADPSNAVAGRLLAEALWGLGMEKQALPRLEALARDNPEDDALKVTLAQAYIDLELYDRALEPLRQVTQASDPPARAHLLLGRAYLARGQDPLAIIELQKAIGVDPELADAYVGLGEAEFRRGYQDRALDYVAQAIEKDPREINAYLLKARVLEKRQEDQGVEEALRAGLKANPQGWRAALTLAEHLLEVSQVDEAVEVLAPFAQGDNSSASVYLLAAKLEQRAQRPAQAVPLLLRAYERRDDPRVLRQLVQLGSAHPDQVDAGRLVELAQRLNQDTRGRDLEVILWLARAQDANGLRAQALELLQAAQERFGDDPRLEETLSAIQAKKEEP
jgi:tetratricopeptide (TPR) repeat protein